MRPNFRLLAATIALFICNGGLFFLGERSAHGAEVECVYRPSQCELALVRGTIVKGDYEKVAALYRDNRKLLDAFYLISPGGDAEEAMKIGRLFRRYLIRASAPHDNQNLYAIVSWSKAPTSRNLCIEGEQCLCASACALIWFGAVQRDGRVGLHRPRTIDPRFQAMAPADASATYRRLLNAISGYLEEMEAPRVMVDAMVATSSAEIRWVDDYHDELKRPPSIAEWTDASCGSFTTDENKTRQKLLNKEDSAGLTANEQMLLQFLDKKIAAHTICKSNLFRSHVDRLPPPDVADINPFDALPAEAPKH